MPNSLYDPHAGLQRACDGRARDRRRPDRRLPVESRQLVLVDDGSTDGTRERLSGRDWPENVTLVLHDRNRGKGAALRTGLQHATGDLAAILDADLEYRAADLAPLLQPLLDGDARVVFGTRSWSSHSAFSFWYVMGNKGVTFATNVVYNCWISDVMTCHKAMSHRALPLAEACASGASRSSRRSRPACSARASGSTRFRSRTRLARARKERS